MNYTDLTWITQQNVCRCCLSANGVLDLTEMYISDEGIKEVFIDILRDNLGISISLMDTDVSKLICEVCIKSLRNASKFLKQVIEADRCFNNYWNRKKDNVNNESNCVNKKRVIIEREEKDESHFEEYDSDTPIAKYKSLSNDCKAILIDDYEDNENDLKGSDDKGRNEVIGLPKLVNEKQVSERKRVILTCNTILKDTTACPFRHHKSWFQCFFCPLDFMEIKTLRTHTLQSHVDIENELKKIKRYPRSLQIDISNLECRNCHLNLTDIETMKLHFLEKHNKIIYKECIADYKVDSSPFRCHLCKMEFHVFRTLTTHLNEHYANCICDVCGKSFINSKRLKVHKRTHEYGSYPCTECGKVLKTKISKANHMESHSKRVIKCQICFKPMKHYNDRIKHMSEVHNITHKFTCPICNREYNIKHYLATHIRQTHGNKNKKCLECGMAFITNHGLKKHMLRHTGDRPFSCTVCCKSYARSYSLREHMRVHENDRRLVTPP